MKKIHLILVPVFLILLVTCSPAPKISVILPDISGKTEMLAAREIRKYIYLRTGELPRISKDNEPRLTGSHIFLKISKILGEQEFQIKSETGNNNSLTISGGSPAALLYGAYEFAEQMGIRFYLHGDVIPDRKIEFSLPYMDIRKSPLFKTRGILPFHDFPEGPDWWNETDYKAVIAQLPKLKMNFIGFHTYPWRTGFNGEGPKSEPLVWIGKEAEVNNDGTVRSAYPVLHFHTADSTWGYSPAKTSDFMAGAGQIFETDNYGADYMKGITPWPHTRSENIGIFNFTGKLYYSAFSFAKELGVKICVGTESPLIIPVPELNRNNLRKLTYEDKKSYYNGIFSRITKTYPIDYYWLWTPEEWTWNQVDDKNVKETETDMQIAHEVLNELGNPFTLATCGWVLGPPKDRTEFDRILPKDMPFSCINRGLGYTPVDKGFNAISGRSKWSIPWMEDDPALLTAQLWAGRIRKDAFDSWKFGCDGLMGIHWRTRSIGPTVSALAKAAWECNKFENNFSNRDLPVDDFYADWVKSEFGTDDPDIIKIFTSLDSKGVELKEGYKGDAPLNASDWIRGPGALMTGKSISDLNERVIRYDFIRLLEQKKTEITGKGCQERFNYWLNLFKFNRAVLEATLSQILLNHIIDSIKKESSPIKRASIAKLSAIPARLELAEKWKEMTTLLLSFASTNGELGTIANLEMHNIRKNGNLTGHDDYLKSVLGTDLPEQAYISTTYQGETRVIVTGNQTIIKPGEDFSLRIRVLSSSDNIAGIIHFKQIGATNYSKNTISNIGSHVFEAHVSANQITGDFEYYIEVTAGDKKIVFPSTSGEINNIVLVL